MPSASTDLHTHARVYVHTRASMYTRAYTQSEEEHEAKRSNG